jgi:hypothetical protein
MYEIPTEVLQIAAENQSLAANTTECSGQNILTTTKQALSPCTFFLPFYLLVHYPTAFPSLFLLLVDPLFTYLLFLSFLCHCFLP